MNDDGTVCGYDRVQRLRQAAGRSRQGRRQQAGLEPISESLHGCTLHLLPKILSIMISSHSLYTARLPDTRFQMLLYYLLSNISFFMILSYLPIN